MIEFNVDISVSVGLLKSGKNGGKEHFGFDKVGCPKTGHRLLPSGNYSLIPPAIVASCSCNCPTRCIL